MIGNLYEWPERHDGQKGEWPGGVWRVICRWASIPGVKVIRNVLVENTETGERKVRPWYPAPKRVEEVRTHMESESDA